MTILQTHPRRLAIPVANKKKATKAVAKTKKGRKRKAGGGGAWRAFLHYKFQEWRLSGDHVEMFRPRPSLKEMGKMYRRLSPDEKKRFEELGKLGHEARRRGAAVHAFRRAPRSQQQHSCSDMPSNPEAVTPAVSSSALAVLPGERFGVVVAASAATAAFRDLSKHLTDVRRSWRKRFQNTKQEASKECTEIVLWSRAQDVVGKHLFLEGSGELGVDVNDGSSSKQLHPLPVQTGHGEAPLSRLHWCPPAAVFAHKSLGDAKTSLLTKMDQDWGRRHQIYRHNKAKPIRATSQKPTLCFKAGVCMCRSDDGKCLKMFVAAFVTAVKVRAPAKSDLRMLLTQASLVASFTPSTADSRSKWLHLNYQNLRDWRLSALKMREDPDADRCRDAETYGLRALAATDLVEADNLWRLAKDWDKTASWSSRLHVLYSSPGLIDQIIPGHVLVKDLGAAFEFWHGLRSVQLALEAPGDDEMEMEDGDDDNFGEDDGWEATHLSLAFSLAEAMEDLQGLSEEHRKVSFSASAKAKAHRQAHPAPEPKASAPVLF